MTKRKKWGLALILLPGVALVFVLVAQIIARFALTNLANPVSDTCEVTTEGVRTTGCDDYQTPETPQSVRILNIFSVVVGAMSVACFLPLLTAGIILLVTPGKEESSRLNSIQ